MNNFTQNNLNGDNIMNFGQQPRNLNQKLQEQLKDNILQDSEVDVTSVLGDGEAYNFASEIKKFLEEAGYKVNGVNQAVYSVPINGQIIEPPKGENKIFKIIIGHNQRNNS